MKKLLNQFITIEGCIGAGKTTLSNMLAKDFDIPIMLENFEDNPYLQNFYENPDKNAFSLELFFMAERYQQQFDILNKVNLFDKSIITDYAFFKSFIFANITLKNEDDKRLYKMLFNIINQNIKAPDIILYLHKPVDLLLENIAKRGRDYEQNIAPEYLENLHQAYMDYFKQQDKSTVVIVDTSKLDFVENPIHFEHLKSLLNQPFEKKLNFV